ncbi:MAG: GDSL-type esterase/lipase family protein [Candidatus Sumerlaeia bacterium]|nr:GDSL-type esterase/lipase family protein [Candidatus Sumerlaeia bacterium]
MSLLILFEIILRLLGFNSYQLDFSVYPNVPGDITPRQSITWYLKHIDKKFDISINEQGFRNPGRLRPESYYRILCLGDSSTMGYGVNDDETYPARLASFLDYYYPQMIDVLNAGTIGYTIDDELSYLTDKGLKLKPDLIILEVFFNDVIEQAARGKVLQRAFRQKSLPYTPLKSLLLKTATFHLWRNLAVQILIRLGKYFPENPFDKVDLALNPQKYPEIWKAYLDKLREFITVTKKNNIPLLLIISPDKYQLYEWGFPLYDLMNKRDFQDQIIQIAQMEGVEYLDLLPLFSQRMHINKELFITYGLYDEHQSEIGQLIKAEAILEKIKAIFEQQGIISLSEKFRSARILKGEATATAHISRKWTSQNDAIGIALEGNIDIVFENLRLGSAPG